MCVRACCVLVCACRRSWRRRQKRQHAYPRPLPWRRTQMLAPTGFYMTCGNLKWSPGVHAPSGHLLACPPPLRPPPRACGRQPFRSQVRARGGHAVRAVHTQACGLYRCARAGDPGQPQRPQAHTRVARTLDCRRGLCSRLPPSVIHNTSTRAAKCSFPYQGGKVFFSLPTAVGCK